ncbi:MAG: polyphenol oxidase family protein [Candidatus Saccharimonas sp.]
MIQADQPTCFPSQLLVAVSSKSDGTVLDKSQGIHHPEIVANRVRFCAQVGVDYRDVVYQRIQYGDDQTYQRIARVDSRLTSRHVEHVAADALYTTERGVGLFLPVADCVATVMYCPTRRAVALLHLGRHSSLTPLLQSVVQQFISDGSLAADLLVWMSPSVHQSHYQLEYFTPASQPEWHDFVVQKNGEYYVDLLGFNREQCVRAGVLAQNITRSPINTATNPHYFSHSQGETGGRFGLLAIIK